MLSWFCSLDDEKWEIRFNFPGVDNLERTLSRSDITVMNLMQLIEEHGYGYNDRIYYVKEKGKGFGGMEVVANMEKVEEMLELFGKDKLLLLTVLKHREPVPVGINQDAREVQVQLDEPVVLSVDKDGLTYISEDEEVYPVPVDYSDVVCLGTQQSCNMDKGKSVVPPGVSVSVEIIDSEEDAEYAVLEEVELIKKLKRQRGEDHEDFLFMEKIREQKRMKEQAIHFEGDTDVGELYSEEEEESEAEEVHEDEFPIAVKKYVKRPGPTSRCHHEADEEEAFFFQPTSDEDGSPDDLGSSDDDGFVEKYSLPSGRKRRLKKLKRRVWYDEFRADAHEQFAIKLCFKNVQQFRVALRNYHIAQLRNYQLHRNNPDRIIVKCSEEGCPFYMTASIIKHEKTFCIRKMRALHTCIPHGENTKVTIDWLAHQSEQAVRTDPNTCVDTLMEQAKLKFGVEVPKSKTYRARKKAFDVVIGDQKKQYTGLRDYLQAILDTNPGSRCIVTNKALVEHPSPNPRFHGLFVCLNASKEGFLNGCRPFIGKFLISTASLF